MNTLIELYNNYKVIIFILTFIIYLIYMISFYKLFKKENINKYFAFIPIYNFYRYFKLLEIPFILFFVPIINVLTLILMPYKLAKRYSYNKLFCWITVLFSIVMIPYISFSKRQNKIKEYSNHFIETNEDVDNLEKQLVQNAINEDIYNENNNNITSKVQEHPKEKFIDEIEKNIDNSFEDEIIYDEINDKDSTPNLMEEEVEELKEDNVIEEDIPITNDIIDEIDTTSENNTREKYVETDKQAIIDAEEDKTIAFGGKELVDKYSTEKNNDELKCPRCGSSLVGARGICPGCGLELKNELK